MDLIKKITEYWDRQPCNINHSLSSIDSLDFFKENSHKRYFVEPHIREFAGFHKYQGKKVLEIGCGIGADAAEFVKHGAEYVGIDISVESVKLAQKRFELEQLSGQFHVLSGDQDLTQFGKFDLVYSCGVLHHYPNIGQIIENAYQVLKAGGEFKFLVYAKNSWKYAMIQKGLDQFEAQAGCPYAQVYTEEEIYGLLKNKFNITTIKQRHCFMYNVEKYKQGIYQLEPWFQIMPEDMRTAISEHLGWHLLVESRKI